VAVPDPPHEPGLRLPSSTRPCRLLLSTSSNRCGELTPLSFGHQDPTAGVSSRQGSADRTSRGAAPYPRGPPPRVPVLGASRGSRLGAGPAAELRSVQRPPPLRLCRIREPGPGPGSRSRCERAPGTRSLDPRQRRGTERCASAMTSAAQALGPSTQIDRRELAPPLTSLCEETGRSAGRGSLPASGRA
jgi:hypothetical protein